jgi:hypothetical protein
VNSWLLHVQGVVAEQNTRLAGPMFDIVLRYEEDLGEETTGMLFCSLLDMLLEGAPSSSIGHPLKACYSRRSPVTIAGVPLVSAAASTITNDVACSVTADLGTSLISAAEQPGQAKVLQQRMEDAGYEADGLLLRQLEWQIRASQPPSSREAVSA